MSANAMQIYHYAYRNTDSSFAPGLLVDFDSYGCSRIGASCDDRRALDYAGHIDWPRPTLSVYSPNNVGIKPVPCESCIA